MKVIQTTEANADAIAAIVDAAYGYPSAGTLGPSLVQRPIQKTWDGTGEAPFGWTATQGVAYVLNANDAWYPLDDATLATALASPRLSGAQKTTLTNAAASRPDVPDLMAGGRTPKTKGVRVAGALESR